jgi:hypothetical protein
MFSSHDYDCCQDSFLKYPSNRPAIDLLHKKYGKYCVWSGSLKIFIFFLQNSGVQVHTNTTADHALLCDFIYS